MSRASRSSADAAKDEPRWFRRVTFYGLLSGLCPLIPIPLVDDRALDWVRQRMVAEQLRYHGLEPSTADVRVLAGSDEGQGLRGCLKGCFLWPVVRLTYIVLRKIFRKVLILLTLNESVERFSESFHQGYLLHRALAAGSLDLEAVPGSPRSPQAVRAAILATLDDIDPRPVRQLIQRTLRGSRGLMLRASRLLGRIVRRRPPAVDDSAGPRVATAGPEPQTEEEMQGEEAMLSGVLDRLVRALGSERGYLEALERRFDEARADSSAGSAADPAATDEPA